MDRSRTAAFGGLLPPGLANQAALRSENSAPTIAVRRTYATNAKRSRHHTEDKQRFVVSVVAYDSLPGHQSYDIPRCSTTFYDAAPVRERNVVRQLTDRSTLHWRSLVTWRGLISQNERYGTATVGAKRPFIRQVATTKLAVTHQIEHG
jgi:hypothetical protein